MSKPFPIGRTITGVRPMTEAEKDKFDWPSPYMVVVMDLDDGSVLIPSRDYEMNGPGATLALDPDGTMLSVDLPDQKTIDLGVQYPSIG